MWNIRRNFLSIGLEVVFITFFAASCVDVELPEEEFEFSGVRLGSVVDDGENYSLELTWEKPSNGNPKRLSEL